MFSIMDKIKNNYNFKILIIIIGIIVSVFFCFNSKIYASSQTAYNIGKYYIDAKIMKNGNLHITEKIEFDFSYNANGIFRDIMYKYNFKNQKNDMSQTSSIYQASDIENIKVYETDKNFSIDSNDESSQSIYFDINPINDYRVDEVAKRIKIYLSSFKNEKKYIIIDYEVVDAAVSYLDAGELYWNFVGNGWNCYINNFKFNLSFENNDVIDKIKFYPHGYVNINNKKNKNNVLSFDVNHIKPNTAVDIRTVFDKSFLDNTVNKSIKKSYDYKKLKSIENKMTFDKNRFYTYKLINILIICYLVYVIYKYIKENIKYINNGKKKNKGKYKTYYRETLERLSLSEYAVISGKSVYTSDLLIATILDLKYKKILNIDVQRNTKNKIFDKKIEYNYYISINNNLNEYNLSEYEILIINTLFNGKCMENKIDENIFNSEKIELNRRLKVLACDTDYLKQFNKKLGNIDKSIDSKIYLDKNTKLNKFLEDGIKYLIIAILLNCFIVNPMLIQFKFFSIFYIFGLIFLGVFLSIHFSNKNALKPEYYTDYNCLKSLENYLTDYSLIREKYPIEIELWGKYLVFASLFGIANKVAKEFENELINKGYNKEDIYMNYSELNISINSFELRSLANSYTSYSNGYSGGYSGGFSSGGFSGGGSGGGGRRRWRRRFVLK